VSASATSPAASPSASPAATGLPPASESDLDASLAAFGEVQSLGLKEETSEAADGTNDERAKVTSGGAVCQSFVDASAPYGPAYEASAEADRAYDATTGDGPAVVQVAVVSHTSPAAARLTVEDARTSAKGCVHLTVNIDGSTTKMNLAPIAEPTMGDDSAVVRAGTILASESTLVTMVVAQVGTETVHVLVGSGKRYEIGFADEVVKELVPAVRIA